MGAIHNDGILWSFSTDFLPAISMVFRYTPWLVSYISVWQQRNVESWALKRSEDCGGLWIKIKVNMARIPTGLEAKRPYSKIVIQVHVSATQAHWDLYKSKEILAIMWLQHQGCLPTSDCRRGLPWSYAGAKLLAIVLQLRAPMWLIIPSLKEIATIRITRMGRRCHPWYSLPLYPREISEERALIRRSITMCGGGDLDLCYKYVALHRISPSVLRSRVYYCPSVSLARYLFS